MSENQEQGGCLCGAIRFAFDRSAAVAQAHCHCPDCQRSTGSAFATIAFVPEPAFQKVKGEAKGYEVAGDSGGKVKRFFCPECGSQLYSQVEVSPGIVFVKAGAMDDASWFAPSMVLWSDTAQPWAPAMPEGLSTHAKNPG